MALMDASVEQYRGSAYRVGYLQGKKIDDSLISKVSLLENKHLQLDKVKQFFRQFAPHIMDEISGLADALGMKTEKAVALFGGYGVPEVQGMGCSSVVNSRFAVRNYDFSPDIYDQRFMLIQPKECYASVGHSLHVIGRHEGVNEKGLFVAFHFVSKDRAKEGLTASMGVRMVLDCCQSTKEAIKMLKQLPHSWNYNFSLGDKNGHTAVVEISPYGIKVRENESTLRCTNHYQHKDLVSQNKVDYTESNNRISYMKEKNMEELSGREVFDWFKSIDSPMFYRDYNNLFGTLHTFAYIYDTDLVLTSLLGGQTLEIDWKDWLEGSNVKASFLTGNLVQVGSQSVGGNHEG
ncbi:C45 family autoproteolytic acyltransferase/hydolase [Sediminibacillus halophilus]|uniref:Predicted choloylglycine hydrolase n=1 Tax=Sediminibacillus halophilus TaxID=482461 RepID=A0A1G9W7F4_9BACI|nr:C45 family peptidase [Sediminibacillus halophilus]SDM79955.1 Predicted choloylglycine hydrolase [Sediminibacillus halophilus]